MNKKELIMNEIEMDYEGDGRSREEYIEDMDMILKSKEYMDCSIVDICYNNGVSNDDELILSCWREWKRKSVKLNRCVERELFKLFDEEFEKRMNDEKDFDKVREELEFDNYEELSNVVWKVCKYIKFESIIEIYEDWIESL